MRMLTKAHEWAADHFSAVQYPRVRAIGRQNSRGLRFTHRMPPSTRLAVAATSLLGLFIGLGVLGAVVLAVWCLATG